MNATFYYNKSDKRYLNKSIEAKYNNIDIQILSPSSVVRPTIKVSSGLIGQGVNYVYIQELERYYYITDWVMENGYIQLSLEVDVLMSFKSAINAQNVIVARNEYNFNMYLDDIKYNTQARTATRTVVFPSGFMGHQIILGVVGNGASS